MDGVGPGTAEAVSPWGVGVGLGSASMFQTRAMEEKPTMRMLVAMMSGVVVVLGAPPGAAQDIAIPVPKETPDVKMPAGDAARGIPMPTGDLDQSVYRERRRRLMEEMGGGVAVIFGADHIDDGGRQNSDFYYFTGLADEAGAAIVLSPEEPLWTETLFLASVNPEADRWSGERAMLGRAMELGTGFARVMRTSRLPSSLSSLTVRSKDRKLVYLGPIVGYTSPIPKALDVCKKTTARIPGSGIRLAHEIVPLMRQVHDDAELALMRNAIDCTRAGLLAAMRGVKRGMSEYELKQVIERGFRSKGSRRLAFPSIVGSGPNGAVLHYRNDTRTMHDGELVLCDVGAEWQHYASDVTRTFPVSGRFSPRQREVYNTVLRAQQAAIDAVRPGARIREDVHQAARDVIEQSGFTDYFFHGTSHFVGIDVHDAGLYDKPLVPGTVITVEPGIYIAGEALGVRIEDEVLVTEDGCTVLTAAIPRTIEDIEAVMAGGR